MTTAHLASRENIFGQDCGYVHADTAWINYARKWYANFIGAGKGEEQALKLAIEEANAAEADGEF